jgi:hypothetical protein
VREEKREKGGVKVDSKKLGEGEIYDRNAPGLDRFVNEQGSARRYGF